MASMAARRGTICTVTNTAEITAPVMPQIIKASADAWGIQISASAAAPTNRMTVSTVWIYCKAGLARIYRTPTLISARIVTTTSPR